MCRLPRGLLVLVAVVALAGVIAGTAAASCDPGRTPGTLPNSKYPNLYSWQDEWEAGPDLGGGSTCYNGSLANIQVKGPNVQYGNDDVWTGIIDASVASGSQVWGQIGYEVDPGKSFWVWEETRWHDSSGWHSPVVPLNYSIDQGDDPEFKVTYSSNYMHYFINDDNYYNRDLTAAYSGCDAVQSSEVHNKGDQAPGEPTSHESITHSELRNPPNGWVSGNWSNPFTIPVVDWLKHQVQSDNAVDFWDSCTT